MLALDWIHVVMFVAGLGMQYAVNKLGSSAGTPSANPLLDLLHKMVDQQAPAQPVAPEPPHPSQPFIDLIHRLLDNRSSTAPAVPTPAPASPVKP